MPAVKTPGGKTTALSLCAPSLKAMGAQYGHAHSMEGDAVGLPGVHKLVGWVTDAYGLAQRSGRSVHSDERARSSSSEGTIPYELVGFARSCFSSLLWA
ncbi:hypothetical protein PENSPDRAFT_369920 [Peniophora sp. CONT]|nr:hypothetical protein PENSPDRAFT_369920 [Peniophora sp. CONT]